MFQEIYANNYLINVKILMQLQLSSNLLAFNLCIQILKIS
jgi:hypothetical protein